MKEPGLVSHTEYDSGPGCKVCDRRILWREGQGWCHAKDATGPLVYYPNEDPFGHEAEGSWV